MCLECVPPAIGFVRCSVFEYAVGDASDVARNGMTRVVFGNTLRHEVLVVLSDRVVIAVDGCHRGSLVHGLQRTTVSGIPAPVAAPPAELLVSDEAAVGQIVSSVAEAAGIDNDGNDLDSTDRADAFDLQKMSG